MILLYTDSGWSNSTTCIIATGINMGGFFIFGGGDDYRFESALGYSLNFVLF